MKSTLFVISAALLSLPGVGMAAPVCGAVTKVQVTVADNSHAATGGVDFTIGGQALHAGNQATIENDDNLILWTDPDLSGAVSMLSIAKATGQQVCYDKDAGTFALQ